MDLDALLSSPQYFDALYEEYKRDPTSVRPDVAAFFREYESAPSSLPSFLTEHGALPDGVPKHAVGTGIQIYDVVHTFRQFGHMVADIDPLGRSPREHPFLDLGQFGFSRDALSDVVSCEGYHGLARGTLQDHIAALRETYCGPIGVEFMDVMDAEQRDWLQCRMEPIRNRPQLAPELKRTLLRQAVDADCFEESLGKMYTGAKRFSLEGGTTLVNLLKVLVEQSANGGVVEQLVFGMAHRGRLNVLANVMQKPLEYILAEFEERPQAEYVQGYGDVKYHLGYSHDYTGESGRQVHLSLAFNPSHLEIVNPVVEGIVRAKQDRIGDRRRERIVPVLVHGDAAFAGQGVVAETLTLAALRGYQTGGTVHVIVNNQVGFTAEPEESRSTPYASDLAKGIRAPVFHVNADHPEAVYLVGLLALEFRQRFHRDVVIDLICFRRHGHNEIDDPSFTQPVMTRLIANHASVSRIYAEKLRMANVIADGERDVMANQYRERLDRARERAKNLPAQVSQRFGGMWQGLKPAGRDWSADTRVPLDRLHQIATSLADVPPGWNWHKRLKKIIDARVEMVTGEGAVDWATGEALAFGSLVLEGTPVRLSGQDSGRGTFSHRHAVYSDMESGERYVPLAHLGADQGRFEVINSPLSEEAVLGFEYGYSSADPWTLVVWEAQFGDFVNGAQVIVDQLIASAEYKWGRMSGLVMLLPHGYEGQGPEHSSARVERFLELCAESNIQVVNATTPAQIFHCLRRQIHREFRKPLVVMSPKSLLRNPEVVSPLRDLADGTFQPLLDDAEVQAPERIERALLCTGKIYYALRAFQREQEIDHTAILRLEQLYPYPVADVKAALSRYPNLRQLVWVQEEPRNMGAWRNLLHRFQESTPQGARLRYVGRDSRAVPATGAYEHHRAEELDLVRAAFERAGSSGVVRRLQKSKRRDPKNGKRANVPS